MSAKRRASTAIRLIKNGNIHERNFDDCFEMGDGDEVMYYIAERARTDKEVAEAILEYVPQLGTDSSNKRLMDAIEECLHGKGFNLFTCEDF
ncbi:hypothetical protein ABEX78_19585 [Priestia megaterium]